MADDEQTNPENDPGVAETAQTESTQAEPEQVEPVPQQQQPAASHEHRNQWILFGILVGILIGTVLVIAVLRPLIFDRIVPAVMGDFVTPTSAEIEETAPVENQPSTEDAAPVDENNAQEETETDENEVFIPAASGGGSGDTAPPEDLVSEPEAEEAVSEPTPEPVTHTVQVGDNLTKISAQYGVPVQDIMAANGLTNADYIAVGQILVIPTN